jgi:hypothetical protein
VANPGRHLVVLLALLCTAALATVGFASVGAESSSAAKKRCRTVVKKVRGKSKRVRVCAKPKAKPARPAPSADLAVAAVLAPEEPLAGEPVVYRVVVVNRGPSLARSVTLSIESQIDLAAVRSEDAASGSSEGAANGTCDAPGEGPTAFRCRIATLGARDAWAVEIEGTPPESGLIRFAAAVRSATADPAPRNGATQDEIWIKPNLPPGQMEPPPPPLDPQPPPG